MLSGVSVLTDGFVFFLFLNNAVWKCQGWPWYVYLFITAQLTIAKIWNQPKCPSVNEWIKKIWGVCVCVSIGGNEKTEQSLVTVQKDMHHYCLLMRAKCHATFLEDILQCSQKIVMACPLILYKPTIKEGLLNHELKF